MHSSCFLYFLGKAGVDRLTADMDFELKKRNKDVSVMSIMPGFVRTEHMSRIAGKTDTVAIDYETQSKY